MKGRNPSNLVLNKFNKNGAGGYCERQARFRKVGFRETVPPAAWKWVGELHKPCTRKCWRLRRLCSGKWELHTRERSGVHNARLSVPTKPLLRSYPTFAQTLPNLCFDPSEPSLLSYLSFAPILPNLRSDSTEPTLRSYRTFAPTLPNQLTQTLPNLRRDPTKHSLLSNRTLTMCIRKFTPTLLNLPNGVT